MFRTTMCPSSREETVSMRHFLFVTLCRWLIRRAYQTVIYIRATMCPSSEEITVCRQHVVFVTLCGWLHTRQSSTQSEKYKVSQSYFSWWWAHSCPKHVEERNKHTKKNCAPSGLYLQDRYRRTQMQAKISGLCSSIEEKKIIKSEKV